LHSFVRLTSEIQPGVGDGPALQAFYKSKKFAFFACKSALFG
jgi:hypothetical protein